MTFGGGTSNHVTFNLKELALEQSVKSVFESRNVEQTLHIYTSNNGGLR